MAIFARGLVEQTALADAVGQAAEKLAPVVVRLAYSVGEDSSGDPSILFRIVLTDSASAEATLADVTRNIIRTLDEEIQPREQWGLLPYFRFRSESELALLQDPDWA